MATLNYKYRLCPTTEQEVWLGRTMFFLWRGWTRLVRFTRQAERQIGLGHAATLRSELAQWERKKQPTGMRAAKLNALIASGSSEADAAKALNRERTASAWRKSKSGLAVEYAIAKAEQGKQSMLGDSWGSAWAKLNDKYRKAWKAVWDGVRERPRRGSPLDATWIERQVLKGRAPILHQKPQGVFMENYIDLKSVLPPRFQDLPERIRNGLSSTLTAKNGIARQQELDRLRSEFRKLTSVRFIQHRPFPERAVIKDFKITRSSIRLGSTWHIIFAVDVPDDDIKKDYPSTGLACGIDPGRKTALTVYGEDMQSPGTSGEEFGPGKPFPRVLKKLRRLQRKLDRQRRANNPDCFDTAGRWIKGRRLAHFSKNMVETQALIAETHLHVANIRKDRYNKVADQLLTRYDAIYLGNWKDATPSSRRDTKKARQESFAQTGEKRAKGEAARQRTANRNDRDNALGVFRQILQEKAKRSSTAKTVIEVKEANTTRSCVHCGKTTGPQGIKGLGRRKWICSACGFSQERDRGAAYNILKFGREQVAASQAAGQAVKGGSHDSSVARVSAGNRRKGAIGASGTGTGVRKAPTSRARKGRVSKAAASGHPAKNPRGALASAQLIHDVGVGPPDPAPDVGSPPHFAEALADDSRSPGISTGSTRRSGGEPSPG